VRKIDGFEQGQLADSLFWRVARASGSLGSEEATDINPLTPLVYPKIPSPTLDARPGDFNPR
jgi:hypothetical protein